MTDTYILVDGNDNVVNAILWDGDASWQPPTGLRAIQYSGTSRKGWKWDGSKAYDPDPPPQAPLPPEPPQAGGMTVV